MKASQIIIYLLILVQGCRGLELNLEAQGIRQAPALAKTPSHLGHSHTGTQTGTMWTHQFI